jgi:hypothetical protein
MAERASMVRISAWVDELKRMQRWVDGLRKQHRKAEACDKQIASPANKRMWPGNSQSSLRPSASFHELA